MSFNYAETQALSGALHSFIEGEGEDQKTSADRQIAALDALFAFPFSEQVDSVILMGLRSSHSAVISHAIHGCLQRLERTRNDEESTRLIELILSDCFLNLSGRRPSSKPKEWGSQDISDESAAARLFKSVQRFLLQRPLQYDHHIARVLSRSRQIGSLAGTGDLAEEVVQFQAALAASSADAASIARLRRDEAYLSDKTSEATLLAYLEMDSRLPVEDKEVTPHLIRVYRILLGRRNEREPWLRALQNLTRWLDQMPAPDTRNRVEQFDGVVSAAQGMPWDQISNIHAVRHLDVQYEFLPGRDRAGDFHPDDFLWLLQRKFAAPEHERQLVAGLGFLQRLPALRDRVGDLQLVVLDSGKYQRSATVWTAFIQMIEAHVTGLDAVVPSDSAELSDAQRRRLKLMTRSLKADQQLRALLHTLATDFTEKWSNNPAVEDIVREQAWRALIRCLPPNKGAMFQKGLCDFHGRFFLATVQEAAEMHQRGIWTVLESHWTELLDGVPEHTRNARLEALAAWFEKSRPVSGVLNHGDHFGAMMRLALDPNEPMQERYRSAVINAGYQLELEKESQRLQILNARTGLTESNSRVLELESEMLKLTKNLNDMQLAKTDHVFGVQELLAKRERLVTAGWLSTTKLQIDLAEIKEQLIQVLNMARVESEALNELQKRMSIQHRECRSLRNEIANLVERQKNEEDRRDRNRQLYASSENERSRAQSDFQQARRELDSLTPPSQYGHDPEAVANFERDMQSYRSHQSRLALRVSSLEGSIRTLTQTMEDLSNSIRASESEISKLQSAIVMNRGRIQGLERTIDGISAEFERGRARWQQLRDQIAQLQGREGDIGRSFDNQREYEQNALHGNTTQVNDVQQRLAELHREMDSLSKALNVSGDRRDRQITRSQELTQAIQSGRQTYDDVAERALPASAHADHEGHGSELGAQSRLQEKQAELVQYAYGSIKAMEGKPIPPTAQEYEEHRHAKRRKGRTT